MRRPRCLVCLSYFDVPHSMVGLIVRTVCPPMRFENKKHRIQSDPNERCAHGQTNRQHHVDPVSLRRWINEIGDDAGWRLQARPIEHRLCCRCHRLRCGIGILRHGDCMGDIAALVQAGWPFIYTISGTLSWFSDERRLDMGDLHAGCIACCGEGRGLQMQTCMENERHY